MVPTPGNPAFVWEIEIGPPLPRKFKLIDPVQEVARKLGSPLASVSYQHDGAPEALVGLIDTDQAHLLSDPAPVPDGANPPPQAPNITKELRTLIFAIRDAEILVAGTILPRFIRNRLDVR
jgi:hypothetical protein